MSGNLEMTFGVHAVAALVERDAASVRVVMVDRTCRNPRVGEVAGRAEGAGIGVHRVSRAKLDKLAHGERHQGIAAQTRRHAEERAGDVSSALSGVDNPLVLVLDCVQDPHNLGACLRTAESTGVDAVVVPSARAVGLTPVVRKVACGAAESVNFVCVVNLVREVRALKEKGLRIVGAAGDGGRVLYDVDLAGPTAIVLGGEEKGLRRLTREACDEIAHIPMAGKTESLNVSVAAAVFLYESVRQRTHASAQP